MGGNKPHILPGTAAVLVILRNTCEALTRPGKVSLSPRALPGSCCDGNPGGGSSWGLQGCAFTHALGMAGDTWQLLHDCDIFKIVGFGRKLQDRCSRLSNAESCGHPGASLLLGELRSGAEGQQEHVGQDTCCEAHAFGAQMNQLWAIPFLSPALLGISPLLPSPSSHPELLGTVA